MKKIWQWLTASNRMKHYGLGAIFGLAADDLYCAIYGGAGVSLAMEWKDGQWGGKPDLLDAAFTFAGVMTGFGIRYIVLTKIIELW